MEIADGIGLRSSDVLPAEADRAHAALHSADHILNFFLDARGTEVAIANRALRVVAGAFPRLTAAGNYEGRRRLLARPREREGVERRLGRRIDLGADIAARDRIGAAIVQTPFGERLDIVLIELRKPSSVNAAGERSSQAQNAVSGRPAAWIYSAIVAKPSASGSHLSKRTRSIS